MDVGNAPDVMHKTYINLHDMTNLQRQALLWLWLEDLVVETAGLVILDGSADFITSVINEVEVDEFMQRLRRVASQNNICIVLTIHENKGSTSVSPRGHLGSDILRRCSNILTVSKDRKAGLHTIAVEKARGGRSGVDWQFRYDDEAKAHVSTGKRAEESGAYAGVISRLAVELKPGITYTTAELHAIIATLKPDITSGTDDAKKQSAKRIMTAATTAGIIGLAPGCTRGKYRVVQASQPDFDNVLPF